MTDPPLSRGPRQCLFVSAQTHLENSRHPSWPGPLLRSSFAFYPFSAASMKEEIEINQSSTQATSVRPPPPPPSSVAVAWEPVLIFLFSIQLISR